MYEWSIMNNKLSLQILDLFFSNKIKSILNHKFCQQTFILNFKYLEIWPVDQMIRGLRGEYWLLLKYELLEAFLCPDSKFNIQIQICILIWYSKHESSKLYGTMNQNLSHLFLCLSLHITFLNRYSKITILN